MKEDLTIELQNKFNRDTEAEKEKLREELEVEKTRFKEELEDEKTKFKEELEARYIISNSNWTKFILNQLIFSIK